MRDTISPVVRYYWRHGPAALLFVGAALLMVLAEPGVTSTDGRIIPVSSTEDLLTGVIGLIGLIVLVYDLGTQPTEAVTSIVRIDLFAFCISFVWLLVSGVVGIELETLFGGLTISITVGIALLLSFTLPIWVSRLAYGWLRMRLSQPESGSTQH